MDQELWSHGLDGISRDVHPTAQVDIPTGTVREFITEYLTPDGRQNIIIGQSSVNGSVKVTGFTEIWGSSLPYISYAALLDETRGWVWTTASYRTNPTPTERLGSSTNAIPDNYLWSTFRSRVVRSHNHNYFLHCRNLERLWRLYNPSTDGQSRLIVCATTWFCRKSQHRYFLVSNTNLPAAQ